MAEEDQATQTITEPTAPATEDSSQAASSPAEPTTSEPTAQETKTEEKADDTAAPAETNQAEDTEHQQSRSERRNAERESRIRQLVGENKQLKGQFEPGQIPQMSPQAPRLSELVAGKDTIQPEELDKLGEQVYQQAAQTARGLNSLEVQQLRQEIIQREAISESEKQAAILQTQYPELNPSSDSFNPSLDKTIAQTYQRLAVKQDPTTGRTYVDPSVQLTDVATDLIELARSSVESGKAQTSATLARQADQTAVLPNSDSPSEKSFDQMTMQEQEQYLRSKGHDI